MQEEEEEAKGELRDTAAMDVADADLIFYRPAATGEKTAYGYWDDVFGGWLPVKEVEEARALELQWLKKQQVYCKVAALAATGHRLLDLKWIDTDKGGAGKDPSKRFIRSRLVCRDIKARKKESEKLTEAELFSATPPLEALKLLLAWMAAQRSSKQAKPLKLAAWDVSRAHLYGKVNREVYCTLPEGDEEEGMIALLLKSLYGLQDASKIGQGDWAEQLTSSGWRRGVANPAILYHPESGSCAICHGDDFLMAGDEDALQGMDNSLKAKYEVKLSGKIGFGATDSRELEFLHRVIRCDPDTGAVELEPDQRHARLIVQELGLDAKSCKGRDTPVVKLSLQEAEYAEKTPLLDRDATRTFRSILMRAAYLSQDRADLQVAVKELASKMCQPREAHFARLRRLGQYLLKVPCLVQTFRPQQQIPTTITVVVDSDHAGDPLTRRSTSGVVSKYGSSTIRCQSNWQSTVSLSSGESEFYAIVKGMAQALYCAALAADLGISLQAEISGRLANSLEIYSDSSAARSFAQRLGLGRQKHVDTRFLWVQERASRGEVLIKRVGTAVNEADALTKPLAGTLLRKHLAAMGLEQRATWSRLHRDVGGFWTVAALAALPLWNSE
eukprot:5799547-Amphidinium_carterae.1